MAISVVGVASAAAASVTLPAHQAGDLILVSVRRASTTPPTTPAAGGTVPTFVDAQSGGANTLSLKTSVAIATASNHTSGTWTNAAHIIVIVLRGSAGALSVGASSTTDAASTQTIVYPALTMNSLGGSSAVIRTGTRVTADSEVANAPTSYTNEVVQPAGASALIAGHRRFLVTSNPTADTVNTTGTAAAYRAHTIEIREAVVVSPAAASTAASASVLPTLGLAIPAPGASAAISAPLPLLLLPAPAGASTAASASPVPAERVPSPAGIATAARSSPAIVVPAIPSVSVTIYRP